MVCVFSDFFFFSCLDLYSLGYLRTLEPLLLDPQQMFIKQKQNEWTCQQHPNLLQFCEYSLLPGLSGEAPNIRITFVVQKTASVFHVADMSWPARGQIPGSWPLPLTDLIYPASTPKMLEPYPGGLPWQPHNVICQNVLGRQLLILSQQSHRGSCNSAVFPLLTLPPPVI